MKMGKSSNNKEMVHLPAGTRTTATYDGNGKRRSYGDSAGFRKFLWDGKNILLVTDVNGVTGRTYTLRPEVYGELVCQRSGTTSFHHYDALGSTRNLTDANQGITDTRDYKAFGLTNASSGANTNRFWWNGKWGYYFQPDPGNIWVRARILEQLEGRWKSRDNRMRLALLGDVQNYVYSRNAPIILVDPAGLQPFGLDLLAPSALDFLGAGIAALRGALAASRRCIDEVVREAWSLSDKTGLPGRTGGKRDAFRHCLGSCKMVRRCGPGVAWMAGTGHELWAAPGFSPILRYPALSAQDLSNNATGRGLGACGRNSGKQCHDLCMDALRRGRLTTAPVQAPGPPPRLGPFWGVPRPGFPFGG